MLSLGLLFYMNFDQEETLYVFYSQYCIVAMSDEVEFKWVAFLKLYHDLAFL